MNSVTLKVEGMHCEGCAQTIERAGYKVVIAGQ